MHTHSLKGKHIVIWGGTGGIGSAIAHHLADLGVQAISFTGRKEDVAKELAAQLKTKGVEVFFRNVDRLDPEGHKKFLWDAAQYHEAQVHGVVDTIGISPNTPVESQTVEEWKRVFEINVIGSFVATRASADYLAKVEGGAIVLITSSNGVNSQAPYSAHYDASKAAQAHMMRTLAEPFMKENVRLNAVAPGWVKTTEEMLPPSQEEIDKETEKIWIGRFAETTEISSAVAFLLSSDSSYIVGQNILVDGGYR